MGIPAIIIVIYLKGYYDKFAGLGTAALAGWMIVALVLLGIRILLCDSEEESENSKRSANICPT